MKNNQPTPEFKKAVRFAVDNGWDGLSYQETNKLGLAFARRYGKKFESMPDDVRFGKLEDLKDKLFYS